MLSGKADENRIVLELNGTQNASSLNYLPNYIENVAPYFRYTGPYITNKLGMRAFSFYNFPIGVALKTPVLEAKTATAGIVNLSWTDITGATAYVLERKSSTAAPYEYLGTVPATIRTFEDKSLPNAPKIYYRVKAVSANAESLVYGYAESDFQVVLGTAAENTTLFSVYPNPVVGNEDVKVRFKKPVTGTISLLDQTGKVLKQQQVRQQQEVNITHGTLPTSIYLLHFKSGDAQHVSKLLIK
ncbi:T9SS type A sorting domain-containing protein [Dyadobacter sp. CY312]|uniref:T9SS type A sorting domain-containing protein n=1 Tax=Dyadobacter sp. CY312 TaxID=2907303 RepID=UPI001F2E6B0B|nr:T9SS type A sorting domain-containing protein [Dyadobacter sp. CY312]MCE7040528.1 T9SS type A sorting domain-containing protein [Dyadobacter sp. CY312]